MVDEVDVKKFLIELEFLLRCIFMLLGVRELVNLFVFRTRNRNVAFWTKQICVVAVLYDCRRIRFKTLLARVGYKRTF